MRLGLPRVYVFLPALRRFPDDWHRTFSNQAPFLFAQRVFRRLRDARVNHLAATYNVAMPGKLTVISVEGTLAGVGLKQAFLERPDRCPIRYVAAATQTDKALEAQAVEQLKFHLLVAQIE